MKTKISLRSIASVLIVTVSMLLFGNRASFNHPVAKHDLDGDGVISDGEYRQANDWLQFGHA